MAGDGATADDAASVGSERLVRGYAGRLLLACSLGRLALSVGRFALAPMLPAIVEGQTK
jgi:hypothetical protein